MRGKGSLSSVAGGRESGRPHGVVGYFFSTMSTL